MAEVVSVGVNLEAFSLAINAIQALRSSVTRVFDSLKDGMKNKETLEGREKAFITDFQDNLQSVNRDLKFVKQPWGTKCLSHEISDCSDLKKPQGSFLKGMSVGRKISDCSDLKKPQGSFLKGMSVGRKLQYHAGLASSLLNQQSLKRSANQMGASAKRRPKVQPTTLVLPPHYVDDVISRIGRMFPDMSIELFRPNGTSAVLLSAS
ncbi:UNVERIFIED_CONTAM: hypothetical protein FKN15_056360 [Acipenser sinensis]